MSTNIILIPNTTQVPNILLDEVIPKLKPGAVRVLLAIVRFTYGYGKSSDRISLNQLQTITGLSRWGVVEAVNGLGDLVMVKQGTKGRGANEYTLNLDITTGKLVKEVDQSKKLTSQVGSQQSRLSQTYSKPRKRESVKGKPSPSNGSDPRIREFFTWWDREYQTRFSDPYVFKGGKEGTLVKNLLRLYDLPRIQSLATRFFESDDSWAQQSAGYTIGVFASQINKLVSTSAVASSQLQQGNHVADRLEY